MKYLDMKQGDYVIYDRNLNNPEKECLICRVIEVYEDSRPGISPSHNANLSHVRLNYISNKTPLQYLFNSKTGTNLYQVSRFIRKANIYEINYFKLQERNYYKGGIDIELDFATYYKDLPTKYNIGDRVKIKLIDSEFYNPGKIYSLYNEYYLVEYYDNNRNLKKIGVKEKLLELI